MTVEEKLGRVEKSSHIVEQAVGNLFNDLAKAVVERAVIEAKDGACTALANKLQDIHVHARSLVANVEMKLAHDRATKMQTADGRDVGDLAEQLDAYQSRFEFLEASLRATQSQMFGQERTVAVSQDCLSNQLQVSTRETEHP